MNHSANQDQWITLERTVSATPEEVWKLWTTPEGIASWWAPEGFTVTVQKLELVPGGDLWYTMTATAPAQIEFMQNAGMPLANASRKTFLEITAPSHLKFSSLFDFIPGMTPYEAETTIELQATPQGTRIVETMEPLHDEEWTQRLTMGRANELENLVRLLSTN
jgi:uncharacterized protein YndB with AHSA1/START domain